MIIKKGISVFLVVKHTTLPNISVLGRNSEGKWVDINDNPSALTFRVYIYLNLIYYFLFILNIYLDCFNGNFNKYKYKRD